METACDYKHSQSYDEIKTCHRRVQMRRLATPARKLVAPHGYTDVDAVDGTEV